MITMDSFGSDCPANWEEIADFLNAIIMARGIEDNHDAINELWEEYCNGDVEGVPEARYSKGISIDNGYHFVSPAEALESISLDVMAAYMDDDAREQTHYELAPCTDLEFLTRYLEIAPDDLIIG